MIGTILIITVLFWINIGLGVVIGFALGRNIQPSE